MIGNKDILVDCKPLPEVLVIFGGGVIARVLGRGTLNIDGFSWFKNVTIFIIYFLISQDIKQLITIIFGI